MNQSQNTSRFDLITKLINLTARSFITKCCLIVMSAVILGLPVTVSASDTKPVKPDINGPSMTSQRNVAVEVNRARSVTTRAGMTDVFIANPVIADIQSLQTGGIFVYGKKPGMTSLFFTYENGVSEEIIVEVTQNLTQLRRALSRNFPHETIQVESSPKGVILMGEVTSSKTLSDAETLADQFVAKDDKVINSMTLASSNQVYLKVRVAEVSRTVLSNLSPGLQVQNRLGGSKIQFATLTGARNPISNVFDGTNLDGFSRSGSANSVAGTLGLRFADGVSDHSAFFDMLDREGLGTVLAEPNLVALSGQKASFLVGGEFAFPVPQDNQNVTIEFKKFGISLEFTPTVISPDRINLRVIPEVSELDEANSASFNVGNDRIIVPSLRTRRADTSVELASGQSFAIAGLLAHAASNTLETFPGLSKIPILGALFSSDQFKREETELVITVTPYLVKPTEPNNIQVPTKGIIYASAAEALIFGKLNKKIVKSGGTPSQVNVGQMHGVAGLHTD